MMIMMMMMTTTTMTMTVMVEIIVFWHVMLCILVAHSIVLEGPLALIFRILYPERGRGRFI
jgi:hypothetical protein